MAAGMTTDNLIIDCLTLAVSADQSMGPVALETMRVVSGELGLNVNMGVSNISFGLPERPLLNATFIAMACAAGLTCAIINPLMSRSSRPCGRRTSSLGHDRRAMGFLRSYRARMKEKAAGDSAG